MRFHGKLHIRFDADEEEDAVDILERMAQAIEKADLADNVDVGDVDESDLTNIGEDE